MIDSIIHEQARPGDLALFALKQDATIVVFLAAAGSSRERQICSLFGADVPESNLAPRDVDPGIKIEITGDILLEELGLEHLLPEQSEARHVGERLWTKFGGRFPSTQIFSMEARASYRGEASFNDPDLILVEWFEWELQLFRYFEQRIIQEILARGFVSEDGNYDVDLFLVEAQTARQRRFSRAGKAFQWNLAAIFDQYKIQYSTEKYTEGKRRPDFLFPGFTEYHDPDYPASNLRTLGAKRTPCPIGSLDRSMPEGESIARRSQCSRSRKQGGSPERHQGHEDGPTMLVPPEEQAQKRQALPQIFNHARYRADFEMLVQPKWNSSQLTGGCSWVSMWRKVQSECTLMSLPPISTGSELNTGNRNARGGGNGVPKGVVMNGAKLR